jgi:hypothetical protein
VNATLLTTASRFKEIFAENDALAEAAVFQIAEKRRQQSRANVAPPRQSPGLDAMQRDHNPAIALALRLLSETFGQSPVGLANERHSAD